MALAKITRNYAYQYFVSKRDNQALYRLAVFVSLLLSYLLGQESVEVPTSLHYYLSELC